MEVYKFGGLSTQDAASVIRVAEIVSAARDKKPLLVFSAMGKTTRLLEKITAAAFEKNIEWKRDFETFRAYHYRIMKDLEMEAEDEAGQIAALFEEVEDICSGQAKDDFNAFYDQVVVYGELIASRIISEYFKRISIANRWVDIRESLIVKAPHREAQLVADVSREAVKKTFEAVTSGGCLMLTQGFIAGDGNGSSYTLGLDGSDYSAALFANMLGAQKLTIWKDVEGVMNADPKYYQPVQKLERLTYHDAIELAFYGANVIHPKTIKPLQNAGIPLEVRSFMAPEHRGTLIGEGFPDSEVPSFIFKSAQTMITLSSRDFSFIVEENLRDIFEIFSRHHVRINLMKNSAISFTVCCNSKSSGLPAMMEELKSVFQAEVIQGLELITVRNYDGETIERAVKARKKVFEMISGRVAQIVVEQP
jgi:aspartate kinase